MLRNSTAPVEYYPDIEASAGHGCMPLDEATVVMVEIARAELDRANVKPEDARIMQVRGDSMRGSLDSGDFVILNIADTQPREGEIFAVSFRGDVFIKKIQRTNTGINLISSNAEYPPIAIADDDQDSVDFRVIGSVAIAWHRSI